MTPHEHTIAALKLMVAWMQNPLNHASDSERWSAEDYEEITVQIARECRRLRLRWQRLEAQPKAAPPRAQAGHAITVQTATRPRLRPRITRGAPYEEEAAP